MVLLAFPLPPVGVDVDALGVELSSEVRGRFCAGSPVCSSSAPATTVEGGRIDSPREGYSITVSRRPSIVGTPTVERGKVGGCGGSFDLGSTASQNMLPRTSHQASGSKMVLCGAVYVRREGSGAVLLTE